MACFLIKAIGTQGRIFELEIFDWGIARAEIIFGIMEAILYFGTEDIIGKTLCDVAATLTAIYELKGTVDL
jgi:hypothetical protein